MVCQVVLTRKKFANLINTFWTSPLLQESLPRFSTLSFSHDQGIGKQYHFLCRRTRIAGHDIYPLRRHLHMYGRVSICASAQYQTQPKASPGRRNCTWQWQRHCVTDVKKDPIISFLLVAWLQSASIKFYRVGNYTIVLCGNNLGNWHQI